MPNADFNFNGQVALVTGASRGIGATIANLLQAQGALVIRTATKASEGMHVLDLADPSSIAQCMEFIHHLPRLDILINNAGVNKIDLIGDIDDADWDRIVAINLTGAERILKAASQRMITAGNGGRVVNVSSIFGVISKSKRNAYSASKAGLIGLTRAAALDLAPHKILVNALCPGFVKTDMTTSILSPQEMSALSSQVPLGRFAHEQEIASAALFLCSASNSYMTGQTLIVDGGFVSR